MAKVSVIVPIYNSEKFISECIESVINQTYKDFELILVDDGSRDSSGEICKKFELKDSRIRYIYKNNGGVSSARNEGLKYARGQYVAFVDSDDIVKPEMLEILLQNDTDFAMCGYELFDDADRTNRYKYSCNYLFGTMHDLAQNIGDYISPPFLLGPWCKLFRKSIIINNNVTFPVELSYGEDAIFVLKYLEYCDTVDISAYVGYSYRKHGKESLSGKFLEDKIDINFRINTLIGTLLQKEYIDEQLILADRLLECFVSYVKELIASSLTRYEKRKLFYDKYDRYKALMGEPQRMAQRIVIWAGKYKLLYPLVYLFGIKR